MNDPSSPPSGDDLPENENAGELAPPPFSSEDSQTEKIAPVWKRSLQFGKDRSRSGDSPDNTARTTSRRAFLNRKHSKIQSEHSKIQSEHSKIQSGSGNPRRVSAAWRSLGRLEKFAA